MFSKTVTGNVIVAAATVAAAAVVYLAVDAYITKKCNVGEQTPYGHRYVIDNPPAIITTFVNSAGTKFVTAKCNLGDCPNTATAGSVDLAIAALARVDQCTAAPSCGCRGVDASHQHKY